MSRLKKSSAAVVAVILAGTYAREGISYVAYYDPVKIPTICAGATKGVRMGMRETPAGCEKRTMADLVEHEAGMSRCSVDVDALPQGVYEAALDFTYNVGVGAFCGSTLAKHLRAGRYREACDEFPKWAYANKAGINIKLPGLVTRRDWERGKCLEGL
jgi:lysozyme